MTPKHQMFYFTFANFCLLVVLALMEVRGHSRAARRHVPHYVGLREQHDGRAVERRVTRVREDTGDARLATSGGLAADP